MSTNHKNMPDDERHEPKGISSAAAGTYYKSNGNGTGSWINPLATVYNSNLVPIFGRIDDISTAGSVFVPCPIAGDIARIIVTLNGAITAANATVSAEINGVAVTGGDVTVAYSGSAGGSTFTGTPSGNKTVSANSAIEIITDGASSTAMSATFCVLMDVS